MSLLGAKYIGLLGITMALFVNFVACGSQMYQVSLKGDTEVKGMQEPFVDNDPSSATYGLHAPNGWIKLPVRFKLGQDITPEQRQGLTRAMAVWELAVGKKLFVNEGTHSGVTGDTFKDLYSSLDDRVNGHYTDFRWGKTGKPNVVLATTIWDNDPDDVKTIMSADIRFNGEFYVMGDSLSMTNPGDGREVVDMQTLALHELGHLLGLAHINAAVDSDSIMTASLYIGEGLANRRLSRGDIERVHRIYGCGARACDVDATLKAIDALDRNMQGASAEVDSAH
jgi:hypothetical protein